MAILRTITTVLKIRANAVSAGNADRKTVDRIFTKHVACVIKKFDPASANKTLTAQNTLAIIRQLSALGWIIMLIPADLLSAAVRHHFTELI